MANPNKCDVCGYKTWRTSWYEQEAPPSHIIWVCTVCKGTNLPFHREMEGPLPCSEETLSMVHASRCANIVLDAIEKLKDELEHKRGD